MTSLDSKRGGQWTDVDGNGIHDVVDDAGTTLWLCHRTVYGAYDYYSALLDNGKDEQGEVEPALFHVSHDDGDEEARASPTA